MNNPIDLKKIIDHESFIQCPFLITRQFISYCKKRSVHTSEKQLELFEKLGLFFPIARVKFPKIKIKVEIDQELNQRKHLGVLEEGEEWDGDIEEKYAGFGWDRDRVLVWFNEKALWEPSSRKFQDWAKFRDKNGRSKIESYYSIFQCYTLYHLKKATEITSHAEDCFSFNDEKQIEVAKGTSDFAKAIIHSINKNGITGENAPSLCQVLSNRFFPHTQTDRRNISISMPEDWDKYCETWDAKSFFKNLDLTIDDIKNIHDRLSFDVQRIDPLEKWYALISFVSLEQKKKLKGTALLAQTFYSMEHMLRLFYQQLTGETLFAPNESYDWHPDRYHGKGVSKNNLEYLELLANQYHLNPRPNLILVVEGNGEEEQFPRLSVELFGYSFSTLGIEVMNAQGIGGYTGKNSLDKYGALEKFIDYFHNKQTIVFVVLDDEGEGLAKTVTTKLIKAFSKHNQERMVTTREYIHFWKKKNIEFENFSYDEIAGAMSERSNGAYLFSANEIRECETKLKEKESDQLSKCFKEKTGMRLNKRALLGALFEYIIKNSENEFDDQGLALRPVSKVLQRVIKLASLNEQPPSRDSWERNQKTGYFGDIRG